MADDTTTTTTAAPTQKETLSTASTPSSEPGTGKVSEASKSVGGDQVQATVDAENELGYRGSSPDPTPRHHYSVAGVTSGKPTPETDSDAYMDAQKRQRFGDRPGGEVIVELTRS